jgi:hypothetical protein
MGEFDDDKMETNGIVDLFTTTFTSYLGIWMVCSRTIFTTLLGEQLDEPVDWSSGVNGSDFSIR